MAGEVTFIVGGDIDRLPFFTADPASDLGSAAIGPVSNTTLTEALPAPGAGKKWHIYSFLITNEHSSVDTVVQVKSANTVKWHGMVKANGGGFTGNMPPNCPIRCGDNEAVNVQCVTSGASVRFSVAAVKSSI